MGGQLSPPLPCFLNKHPCFLPPTFDSRKLLVQHIRTDGRHEYIVHLPDQKLASYQLNQQQIIQTSFYQGMTLNYFSFCAALLKLGKREEMWEVVT